MFLYVFRLFESELTNCSEDGANLARGNELSNLDAQREISCPHSLHQKQLLRLGRLNQLSGLGSGHGEGLLTQDVLAGLQRQHGVLEVVAVGSCYVNDVDVGVDDEFRVRSVRLGVKSTVDFLEEFRRPLAAAGGGYGNNLVAHIVGAANCRTAQEILAKG